MAKVWYAVIATLPSPEIADEYVHWLEDGHVDAVLNAGAHSAMIIRFDRLPGDTLPDAARQVMTQYVFATRELFDRYVEHHAPALRADGLKLFGPERGIKMERRLGEIQ
jgi:hypothetical protein